MKDKSKEGYSQETHIGYSKVSHATLASQYRKYGLNREIIHMVIRHLATVAPDYGSQILIAIQSGYCYHGVPLSIEGAQPWA